MNTSAFRPARGLQATTVAVLAGLLLSACAVPVVRTSRVIEEPGAPPVAQAAYVEYGTVTRIEEIDTRVGDSGGGAALGAVIGGVVGNGIGRGAGRVAATALGIFGGAVVGDNVERNNAAAASSAIYRVFVHFDDGSVRSFDYRGLNGLHSGERVRFEQGRLDRA